MRRAPGGDEARARLREDADPALLARLEGYRERAAELAAAGAKPEIEPRPASAAPTRFRFGAWNLRLAGEPRDIERPPQIADDLQHRTPQAILRDLHRPVRPVPPIRLHPVGPSLDPAAAQARARDAMARRYTLRMADEPNPRAMREEAWNALRDILQAPWSETLPSQPSEASLEPGPEDALWFGAMGGYDPDQ